jgi:AraC-like DNA-binding protein
MFLRHEGFRRLCRARDVLRECDDPPSIAELAREVGISPYHFIRQFEAVFGTTPHQYRIQLRLDRARTLLATGGYSVTRVCMEVGFTSLGSFSSLFCRRAGEPPSNYRRRVLSLPPDRRDLHLTPGCLTLLGHLPATPRHALARNFQEAADQPRV